MIADIQWGNLAIKGVGEGENTMPTQKNSTSNTHRPASFSRTV